MRRVAVALVAGLLLLLQAGAVGAAGPKCPVCGADVGAAKFTVVFNDGKEVVYSCPRCGLLDADLKRVKALQATDFLSRKTVDGRTATYLANTTYGECCPPYWLSFANREDAEKFAKGFDGEVLTFEEALKKLGK